MCLWRNIQHSISAVEGHKDAIYEFSNKSYYYFIYSLFCLHLLNTCKITRYMGISCLQPRDVNPP